MSEMQTQIMEVETLKVKNQKLLEDLTMIQNQERAQKEKIDHLEKDLLKYKRVNENNNKSEQNESQLLMEEFSAERENILADLHSKQNEVFELTT